MKKRHAEPQALPYSGVNTAKITRAPIPPSQRELAALDALADRRAAMPPLPRLKMTETKPGMVNLSHDHPDEKIGSFLLMNATGAMDSDFLSELLVQIGNVSGRPGHTFDSNTANFMLSAIRGTSL